MSTSVIARSLRTIRFNVSFPMVMKMEMKKMYELPEDQASIQSLQKTVFKDLWEWPIFQNSEKHGMPSQIFFLNPDNTPFTDEKIKAVRSCSLPQGSDPYSIDLQATVQKDE